MERYNSQEDAIKMGGTTTQEDKNQVSEKSDEIMQPVVPQDPYDTIHLKPSNDTSDTMDDFNLATQVPFHAASDSDASLSGMKSVDDDHPMKEIVDGEISSPPAGNTTTTEEEESKQHGQVVLENNGVNTNTTDAADASLESNAENTKPIDNQDYDIMNKATPEEIVDKESDLSNMPTDNVTQTSPEISDGDVMQNEARESLVEKGSNGNQNEENFVKDSKGVESKETASNVDLSPCDTPNDNTMQMKDVVPDNALMQNDSNEISPDQNDKKSSDQNVVNDSDDKLPNPNLEKDSKDAPTHQNAENDKNNMTEEQNSVEGGNDPSLDQKVENSNKDTAPNENLKNGSSDRSLDETVKTGSKDTAPDEEVEVDSNKIPPGASPKENVEKSTNKLSPDQNAENDDDEVSKGFDLENLFDNEDSDSIDIMVGKQDTAIPLPTSNESIDQIPHSQPGSEEGLFDDSDDDTEMANKEAKADITSTNDTTNQKPHSQPGSEEGLFDDSDDGTEMANKEATADITSTNDTTNQKAHSQPRSEESLFDDSDDGTEIVAEEVNDDIKSMAEAVEAALVSNSDKKRPLSDVEQKSKLSSPKKKKVQTTCYLGNMIEWAEKMKGKKVTGDVHPNVIRDRNAMNFWKEYPGGDDYPEGWVIHVHKRPSGDHLDWYWFTASGKKLRSRKDITRFMEQLEEGKDEQSAWAVSATSSNVYKAARDPKASEKIPAAKKQKAISKPEKKTTVENKKVIKKANQKIADAAKKKKKSKKVKGATVEADMKMPRKKTISKKFPLATVTQRVAEAKVTHTDGSPFQKLTSKKVVAPEEKMKSSKPVAPTIPSPEKKHIKAATELHVTAKRASKARAPPMDKSSKKTSSFGIPTIAEAK